MKTVLNNKIRKIVEDGDYILKVYNEDLNLTNDDYHYYISIGDNNFHFQHKGGEISLPLKDVEWRIFWDKLGDIPVDEDGDIEESFEHFDVGTDVEDIWLWFEWFFDISIGKECF